MHLRSIHRGLVAMLVVTLMINSFISVSNAFSFNDNWEEKFRAIPKAENLREAMRRLSAEPHHLGSVAGKRNAEWMRDQLKGWGLKAELEEFDVLFPTPKERVLELVSPITNNWPKWAWMSKARSSSRVMAAVGAASNPKLHMNTARLAASFIPTRKKMDIIEATFTRKARIATKPASNAAVSWICRFIRATR